MRVKFRGSIRVIKVTRRVRDGQNEWWKRKLQEKPPSLRFRTFTVFSKRTLFEPSAALIGLCGAKTAGTARGPVCLILAL
jgi:hypothetical protein